MFVTVGRTFTCDSTTMFRSDLDSATGVKYQESVILLDLFNLLRICMMYSSYFIIPTSVK